MPDSRRRLETGRDPGIGSGGLLTLFLLAERRPLIRNTRPPTPKAMGATAGSPADPPLRTERGTECC
jgi:hypothetical protein